MTAPPLITVINPLRIIYPEVDAGSPKTPALLKPLNERAPTTMTSITRNYLLPAILLNPVLLLHTVNTIVARIPTTLASSATPPEAMPFYGPTATSPYFDMHANDNMCWSYTIFMVGVQLVAFGKVSGNREAGRQLKAELLKEDESKRGVSKAGEVTQEDTAEEDEEEEEAMA